jgi:hypothetical protein
MGYENQKFGRVAHGHGVRRCLENSYRVPRLGAVYTRWRLAHRVSYLLIPTPIS